ncbi:hypothetical protein [Mycobacterium riyadhense]|uniref:hypothetical protein n=1 Tax=Mycobacterium riyadhense TaxID=486698 RepID=UPI00195CAD1C|nr:hypothetical protein [Mycobacterium riyadhense]
MDLAAAADTTMPRSSLAAAVDAVAAGGQALGHLERALAAGPLALQLGAPPIAGRLTIELIACGSTVLTSPLRTLRTDRQATDTRRGRRRLPALPSLAAGQRLQQLRATQTSRCARRRRRAAL